MSLEIIGAGFGRTGTVSIRIALEQLGFGPCYHMENLFKSPEELERWQAIADGAPPDWEALFGEHRSTVDWPGTSYWRELADAFPKARVLLNVRAVDGWWASFSKTIAKLIKMRDSVIDEQRRAVLGYAHQLIDLGTFGGQMHDQSAAMNAFLRRTKDVTAHIAPERLLVYDVCEGWEPLCEFLGVPVPECIFPNTNNADEFWQVFGGTPAP